MNVFKRTLLWTLAFYIVNVVAIVYLTKKDELKDADVLLVFVPVLLWACSTEIWGKRYKRTAFYKYGVIDSICKALAFVCAELIYNKITLSAWYYVCLVLFCVFAVTSLVCTVKIMLCEKKYYQLLQQQNNY